MTVHLHIEQQPWPAISEQKQIIFMLNSPLFNIRAVSLQPLWWSQLYCIKVSGPGHKIHSLHVPTLRMQICTIARPTFQV